MPHGRATKARFDVLTIEVQINLRIGQVKLPPVSQGRAVHKGRCAPVVHGGAQVVAGTVPIGKHCVTNFQRRHQGHNGVGHLGFGVGRRSGRQVGAQAESELAFRAAVVDEQVSRQHRRAGVDAGLA